MSPKLLTICLLSHWVLDKCEKHHISPLNNFFLNVLNFISTQEHLMDKMPPRGTWTSSRSWHVGILWGLARPRARYCTRVRAIPEIKTGWGMNRSRTALPRRTWGCWWMRAWTWASKPIVSWAASKTAWPEGQGKWFSRFTQLWWDPTWSLTVQLQNRVMERPWWLLPGICLALVIANTQIIQKVVKKRIVQGQFDLMQL